MKKFLSKLKRAALGFIIDRADKLRLATEYSPMIIGKTFKGEEIYAYRVGTGQLPILFLSGIHGNEIGAIKFCRRLLGLSKDFFADYKRFTFHFIPCLNIDGFKKALKNPDYWGGGRIGRANGNEVDLNRNFPVESFQQKAVWTHGKNYQESTEVFAGEQGGSEPETKALIKFIKENQIKIVFSFHTAGADVVASPIPPAKDLSVIFSKLAAYRLIDHEEWLGFRQFGSSYEWCWKNRIALIEIEGSNRWGSDWKRQWPAVKACLDFLNSEKAN